MTSKTILIHTHFHRRRTGVTRSIENVFSYFETKYDAYVYGYGVNGRKISLVRLLKLVFSKKYFVMHCHRNNEIMRALLFRFLGGNFRLISTRHAESEPSSLTNYLLQKSDVVIALTKNMQTAISYPTVVVGHGVNVDKFKPNPTEKRLEITQKNILTCAGRVRKSKGQKVLVEVAAPLLRNHPDWALVITGRIDKPKFLIELQEIITRQGVENQVYLVDENPEIISYYQASHSVVVPSFTEGFSLVCAEAMACGCNVIATRNVGVHSDIIEENKTGYLFDVQNKSEFGGLLQSLFSGELSHLGENAKNEIVTNWSAQNEADNLMKVYKDY